MPDDYIWFPHPKLRTHIISIPEAGGWIYEYRDGYGSADHVFVPNLEVWAQAFATAADTNRPRSIGLALTAATDVPQPIPEK